jgi:hypothetical protein
VVGFSACGAKGKDFLCRMGNEERGIARFSFRIRRKPHLEWEGHQVVGVSGKPIFESGIGWE